MILTLREQFSGLLESNKNCCTIKIDWKGFEIFQAVATKRTFSYSVYLYSLHVFDRNKHTLDTVLHFTIGVNNLIKLLGLYGIPFLQA